MTNAEFATTTEVYPDSPRATDDICNAAQVTCIEAALKYIIENALQGKSAADRTLEASAGKK